VPGHPLSVTWVPVPWLCAGSDLRLEKIRKVEKVRRLPRCPRDPLLSVPDNSAIRQFGVPDFVPTLVQDA